MKVAYVQYFSIKSILISTTVDSQLKLSEQQGTLGLFQKKYLGGEDGRQYIFLWVVGAESFLIIWVIGVLQN